MSQISAQQPSEPSLHLVPSPYIANYIEQRKALILNKLATPHPPPHTGINQVFESAVIAQITKTENAMKGGAGKTHHKRKASQLVVTESSNKIIKKGNISSFPDTDKFLARSNLYQKQKELKLQFQKRKHLYNSVSEHKFELHTIRQEHLSANSKEKPTKQEENYYYKNEKQTSKNLIKQRKNKKDLIKESMIKYVHHQPKTLHLKNQKLRWKEIQEIFQKIRAFRPHFHHHASKHTDDHKTRINENTGSMQEEEIGMQEIKLTLRKIESEEQKVNLLVQSLQMQHFEEDLSGILMNEDPKEQIDSSHVIQQVVDSMGTQSCPNTQPQKDQIVRSLSILDSCVSEEIQIEKDQKVEGEDSKVKVAQYHCADEIQVREDDWIKGKPEPEPQFNQQLIDIKKVQSQFIDSPQDISNSHHSIPKDDNLQPQHQFKLEDLPVEESFIDKLSEEVLQESKKEVEHSIVQKITLEVLANQFIQQTPISSNQDNDDILIPEEEYLPHHLEIFDFSTISHQIIGKISPMSMPIQQTPLSIHQEPEILINGSAYECQDTTGESEEIQWQEETRVTTPSRTLRTFGDFLVIPEESDEESQQSMG